MKSKKPILFVLGIPGHFYLAEALAKEFDRPVVGITFLGRLEKEMPSTAKQMVSDIQSFPDFYLQEKKRFEAMTRSEFDELFRSLCDSLGIENNNMLVHHDRALRYNRDFKRSRVFQIAVLSFVERVLQNGEPAFVLDGVATYLQLVLRAVCKKRKIPYLLTQDGRMNGHFNLMHENGQHLGMQEVFEDLLERGDEVIDEDTRKAADTYFRQFLEMPRRPSYAERNSKVGLDPGRIIRGLKFAFHPDYVNPGRVIDEIDRDMNYEFTTLELLGNALMGRVRRAEQKICGLLENSPSLDVPFIYLPLHFTPEVSDIYFGYEYDHHAGFVSQFAKHIPSHCQLYVKEHTSMPGIRRSSFYRELNALSNVTVISPAIDTFELIRKSQAVATVTGTAGWEAYLLGKPVIVLGNVFYNFLPGVFHEKFSRDFESKLAAYLNNFHGDEKERMNGFRAFYATCFKATKGDIGQTVTYKEANENAALFAQLLHDALKKWGPTMAGKFPNDL